MTDPRIPTDRLILPVLRPEAWYDPRIVDAASEVTVIDVDGGMGNSVLLLPADTSRYMFTVSGQPGNTPTYMSPWPEANTWPVFVETIEQIHWRVSLFDYGPMVCNKWYLYSNSPTPFRVVTTRRISRK